MLDCSRLVVERAVADHEHLVATDAHDAGGFWLVVEGLAADAHD